ncbi:MAG TPA: DUF58 domain-containing protein [Ktedonobacterales bacterium]|nr:DUF58 domain-containing protein [Ktedonobacterales bacterium]
MRDNLKGGKRRSPRMNDLAEPRPRGSNPLAALGREYRRVTRDETLRRHWLWYALGAVVGVIGLVVGQPIAVLIGLVIILVCAIPEIWYRRSLNHLTFSARWGAPRVFFGEVVPLEITVESQQGLPLPALEVGADLPGVLKPVSAVTATSYRFQRHLLVETLSLWGRQRVERSHALQCTARGVYRLGPVRLRSSDPFGWMTRQEQFNAPDTAETTLVVFPLVAPLGDVSFAAMAPFGELPTPRRLIDDPLRVAGARAYQLGDDPRLIHWKATARTGALQTKTLDPSGQYRFVVALDVNSYQEARQGIDPVLLELSVSAAASFAYRALDDGYATGLLANCALIPLADDEERASASGAFTRSEDGYGGDLGPRSMVITPTTIIPSALPPAPRTARLSTVATRGTNGVIEPGVVWLPPTHHADQRERILTALAQAAPVIGPPIERLLMSQRSSYGLGTTVVLISTTTALRADTVAYLMDLRRSGIGAHLALIGYRGSPGLTPTYDLPTHYIGGREVWYELINAHRQGDFALIGDANGRRGVA